MTEQTQKKSPKQMCEEIFALDLEPIKFRLMNSQEEGKGWTQAQADYWEVEYKRFLALLAKFPDDQIVPDIEVDKFWHQHILDTMKYAQDCDAIFGHFVHHFPYMGLMGEEDAAASAEAFERMQHLYTREFGAWDKEQPVTWSGTQEKAAAWSGSPTAQAAKLAAWSGMPVDKMEKAAAWSGMPVDKVQKTAAWSGMPVDKVQKTAAWSGMPVDKVQKTAAWSGMPVAKVQKTAAWSGMPVDKVQKTAAWSGMPVDKVQKTAAWSGMPVDKVQKTAAWSGVPTQEMANAAEDNVLELRTS